MKSVISLLAMLLTLSLYAMEGTNVIMRIGAATLTRGEYEQYFDMMVDFYKFRNPKAKVDHSADVRKKLRKTAEFEFMRRLALRDKFATYELTNDTSSVRARIERNYARSFCPRKKKFADLVKRAEEKGYKELLLKLYADDWRSEAIIAAAYSNELTCSEADYKAAHDNVNAFNACANATNALIRARAQDVLKRARAGEDFAKLADAYSMEEEKVPGGNLGEVQEDDFTDEPLVWKTIKGMKAGEVTDILSLNDGEAIFKVVKRLKADESNSQSEAILLSRIFFKKAFVFPEESEESFRLSISKEKREKFLKEFNRKLLKEAKIYYPYGQKAFIIK